MDSAIPKEIRRKILYMMNYSRSSHIGGAFSIVEILYTLYFKIFDIEKIKSKDFDRDIFILSKGHNSTALYATLAQLNLIDINLLSKYYVNDGELPGHLDMTKVPFVESSAGSLGHGLGIGLGFAIGKQQQQQQGNIYVVIGDGECNEGSVWEAVMLASTLKQSNLCIIVDYNHLQGMGSNVINQTNLVERFKSFGLNSIEVDGHNIQKLEDAIRKTKKPCAIIAHTVKGKGVSFMENKLEWHYKSPNETELDIALKELE